MAPTPTLIDVIPDAMAGYLSALTTAESIDWMDWTATLQPPAGGGSAYSGLVELMNYTESPAVTRSPQARLTIAVRLYVANSDLLALGVEAAAWARTLDNWLRATSTLEEMAKLGASLAGTYHGVVVPANLCLKAEWDPWQVQVQVNQGDGYQFNAGGIASIAGRGVVVVAF